METAKLRKDQERMAKKLILKDSFNKIKVVGGADQAFLGERVFSSLVILTYKDLKEINRYYSVSREKLPYIPGLLSYREGPPILKTLSMAGNKPDILLVDGNGILHPRGIGLASWVGLRTGIPTIGVAKSLLCGEVRKGKVLLNGKQVGYELKSGKSRIYISPGHKVSLQSSLKIVKETLKGHKLPEPLRLAHLYANEVKREHADNKTK